MILEIYIRWHKLLHLIIPLLAILIFSKRFGKIKVCVIILLLMSLKELYDIFIVHDPLWISVRDTLLNIIGVFLGIISVYIVAHIKRQNEI